MIFWMKPSNRSSLDEDGMTVDPAARLDDRNRRQRAVGDIRVQVHRSWICAATCAGFDMIDVSYWNGLQILQYSSAVRAGRAVVELIRIVDVVVPLIAVVFPGDTLAR